MDRRRSITPKDGKRLNKTVGQTANTRIRIMSQPSALENVIKEKVLSAINGAQRLDRLVLIAFIVSIFPLPIGSAIVLILSFVNLILLKSGRMDKINRRYILISIVISVVYITLFSLVIYHIVKSGKLLGAIELIKETVTWPLTGIKAILGQGQVIDPSHSSLL